MTGYDFDRPFIGVEKLGTFRALDRDDAQRYGAMVKATEMSNVEYKQRFDQFAPKRNMKSPPSTGRIFPGYLVIRRLGRPDEYETWIPDHGFTDSYEPVTIPAPAPSSAVSENDINALLERLDLSAIADPGDKMRECEFFLDLASVETDRTRFRWLISAFLNAVYSFFETSAVHAKFAITNEEGDQLPDDDAVEKLRKHVKVRSDKNNPERIKTSAQPDGGMKRLYEIRGRATHGFPLSIMATGANLPEDFHFGNMRGEGEPVLPLCRAALDIVRNLQQDLLY